MAEWVQESKEDAGSSTASFCRIPYEKGRCATRVNLCHIYETTRAYFYFESCIIGLLWMAPKLKGSVQSQPAIESTEVANINRRWLSA